MIKYLLILILSLYIQPSYAQKYYVLKYTIDSGDTFAIILKKFVKIDSVINKHTKMVKKTKKNNPHVKSWRDLKKGTKIKLYVSERFLDKNKLEDYKNSLLAKKKAKEDQILNKRNSFSSSFFYMASSGMFNQFDERYLNIDFAQYSLFTLGSSFLYFPKNKNYHWSSSLYLSKLGTNTNNLNEEEISIKSELGINVYFSYKFPTRSYSVYGGIDYESFSTFNLELIQREHEFKMNEHKVAYLTLGFDRTFKMFNGPFFFKLSASKSLSSSYTPASGVYDTGIAYSGFKLMFYLNKKISKKFFLHFLYKYHSMSGPDALLVNRLGIGFGYILQ